MLDRRFVYVARIKVNGQDLDKIGIAKSPKSRAKDIESEIIEGVKNKYARKNVSVRIRTAVKVFFAESIEKSLHKYYRRKGRQRFPSIKFSGFTECFDLSLTDVIYVSVRLRAIKAYQLFSIAIFILSALFLSLYFLGYVDPF
jgi:hypothetical protein